MNGYILGHDGGGSQYSDILFHYDCENTAQSTKPNTITGTNNGITWSTSTPAVGSYECYREAWDYMEFSLAGVGVDKLQGVIGLHINRTTVPAVANNKFLTLEYDINNRLFLRYSGTDGAIQVYWAGNGVGSSVTSTFNLSASTDYYVVVSWGAGGLLTLDIFNNSGVSQYSGSVSGITAMTNDPTTLTLGLSDGAAMTYSFDNVVLGDDKDRVLSDIMDNTSYE